MPTYNTIKVKKYSDIIEELVASAAITPGFLIEVDSAEKVKPNGNAAGAAQPIWALENELEGQEITDDYAVDDPVQCWFTNHGDIVYAVLADGETIAIGNELESAGDGRLQKYTSGTKVAVALEAKDLSASSAAESSGITGPQRLLVRSL